MPRPMGPGMAKDTEKAKDFKGTIKKIVNYIKAYRVGIFIVLFFTILSTIFSIIGPTILGNITTEIFEGLVEKITNQGGIDFDYINKTVILLLSLYGFSSICAFIQGYIMNTISCRVAYSLRVEISEKINRLPMKYFDKLTHGEILSRITNDVDTLTQNLN